jgi:hypothetical protein
MGKVIKMILASGKHFYVFLLCVLCWNGLLFAGGRNEDAIGVVSADELYEYDFKLNDRIPREIKKELKYADSINAYYYTSEDSEKIFDMAYFYLKRGRLVRIFLSSYINLRGDFILEEYKPEYVLKICKDEYGEPEMEWIKLPLVSSEEPAEYTLKCKWKIDNVTITYYYLPYKYFKEVKAATSGSGIGKFSLNYSMTER